MQPNEQNPSFTSQFDDAGMVLSEAKELTSFLQMLLTFREEMPDVAETARQVSEMLRRRMDEFSSLYNDQLYQMALKADEVEKAKRQRAIVERHVGRAA